MQRKRLEVRHELGDRLQANVRHIVEVDEVEREQVSQRADRGLEAAVRDGRANDAKLLQLRHHARCGGESVVRDARRHDELAHLSTARRRHVLHRSVVGGCVRKVDFHELGAVVGERHHRVVRATRVRDVDAREARARTDDVDHNVVVDSDASADVDVHHVVALPEDGTDAATSDGRPRQIDVLDRRPEERAERSDRHRRMVVKVDAAAQRQRVIADQRAQLLDELLRRQSLPVLLFGADPPNDVAVVAQSSDQYPTGSTLLGNSNTYALLLVLLLLLADMNFGLSTAVRTERVLTYLGARSRVQGKTTLFHLHVLIVINSTKTMLFHSWRAPSPPRWGNTASQPFVLCLCRYNHPSPPKSLQGQDDDDDDDH
jgi:hypothetical protein